MKQENHFVWADEDYKRDFDQLKHYRDNAAVFLTAITGDRYEDVKEWVDEVTTHGEFKPKVPIMMVLTRPEPGHRIIEEITPQEFFDDIVQNQRLCSPSLAVYHNPHYKKSILSLYIARNVKRRSKAKKEMFAAERAGNTNLKNIKNDEQTTYKTSNNSLSGGHNSVFTILFLKSAHSALTSTCRTSAAYANANNEKFITGNRHYYSPEVTIENLASVVGHSDMGLIAETCDGFGIHYPSAMECLEMIRYSSDFYWPNAPEDHALILKFLEGVSPQARAAIMYTGDAFHLRKYNDDLVRGFLTEMIQTPTTPNATPDHYVDGISDDMIAFVSSLMAHVMDGKSIWDLKKENPPVYGLVAAAIKNTYDTLDKYKKLIKTFWATSNIPASPAAFTESIRRAGVVSDTDSTIFTVQDWCHWYEGEHVINQTTNAIRNTMVYFASQGIIHILAIVSGNMGVVKEQLHQLAMKNEFAFPVFGLTSRGKHYFAFQSEREGNVYPIPHLEIKGVEMKNSKAPREMNERATALVVDSMNDLMEGRKISIIPRLKEIANMEREIQKSIESGEFKFLTTARINNREAYKSETGGPYRQYELWEAVFAEKYGPAPIPPYDAIKVSIEGHSQAQINDWLSKIEDRVFADKFAKYLKDNHIKSLSTVIVPRHNCLIHGVPKELTVGIDVRKLIYSTTSTFYLELESFGFYMANKNNTRLVSDYY